MTVEKHPIIGPSAGGVTHHDGPEADCAVCTSWRASMTPKVPRRAVFDDLRVGQWVAWIDQDRVIGGRVNYKDRREVVVQGGASLRAKNVGSDSDALLILRDAPAPPVQVRREDYDVVVAAWGDGADLFRAVRTMINNADTGETP